MAIPAESVASNVAPGDDSDDGRARLATERTAPDRYNQLARDFPKMSGANLRNAAIPALPAAFLAARENAPTIMMDHLYRAARAEYRSMGHLADIRKTRSL